MVYLISKIEFISATKIKKSLTQLRQLASDYGNGEALNIKFTGKNKYSDEVKIDEVETQNRLTFKSKYYRDDEKHNEIMKVETGEITIVYFVQRKLKAEKVVKVDTDSKFESGVNKDIQDVIPAFVEATKKKRATKKKEQLNEKLSKMLE